MHRLVRGVLLMLAATALSGRPAVGQTPADPPLRPGDRLLLRIWLDSTFAEVVHIDERGAVILPRIGPVSLAGVPAAAIGDSVRAVYLSLTRTPAVEVTPMRRVTVGGEVARPGVLYLETRSTIRDAVTAAGGVGELGVTDRVLLIRGGAERTIEQWERRDGPDVVVQSGDLIWVRRESWLRRNALSVVSAAGVILSVVLSLSK